MFESVDARTDAHTHARTDGHTDARTPARVPSYKLTLWAFGSGELKMFQNDGAFRRVTWCRMLMTVTSQTRLNTHQFEANKS